MTKRLRIKAYGFLFIFCILLGVFSTTAFAKDKLVVTSVTSPVGNQIHVEWKGIGSAAKYALVFKRIESDCCTETIPKIFTDGNVNSYTYKTKYDATTYSVKVCAINKSGGEMTAWSDTSKVFVLPSNAQKLNLSNLYSPEAGKITIEWNEYPGAKYYEVRLARASMIEEGEAGEQHIVDAKTRSVTYKTKFSDVDYNVRVRALNKDKKHISIWSDWTPVHILGTGAFTPNSGSDSSPVAGACSDATFAALQKSYNTTLMIHNQVAAVYALPQVPENPEIENCINTSAEAINQVGVLKQNEMTEADAKELTKSLDEFSSVLLVFYNQMVPYVN